MKEELDGFKEKMKEEMEKDAARIEEAIRADEEISKMKASAELRDKVKERIEAYQREELLSNCRRKTGRRCALDGSFRRRKPGQSRMWKLPGKSA